MVMFSFLSSEGTLWQMITADAIYWSAEKEEIKFLAFYGFKCFW